MRVKTPVASSPIARRDLNALFLSLAGLAAFPAVAGAAMGLRLGPARPFSWEGLVSEARAGAARPWVEQRPSTRAAKDFDAATRITYGKAQALPGGVRLFPTAQRVAPYPVDIFLVEQGKARRLESTDGLFSNGGTADPAGFRIMTPSGQSDWMAYLGASYFRASGSRDQYGLSARGIGIDTALPTPEEFPAFTAFWIEAVAPGHVRIHARLDGPSVTGAYAFDCRHGADAVTQDVSACLFLRRDVQRLCVAPITSMFWYDQAVLGAHADWRPEIHDSDGLAIWSGNGERLWVPLSNPAANRSNAFRADHVKGFGLLQRDQRFDHYQDDGAFYDRRPSLWIEPQGDWGTGAVMLYAMPTRSETQDNVAAFWVSDRAARAGEQRDLAYRMTWTSADPTPSATARCVDMWQGAAGRPGDAVQAGDARKFVFDFAGPALEGMDRNSGIVPVTSLPKEALLAASAYPVVGEQARWRVTLDVRIAAAKAQEFRLFLQRGKDALSETVIKDISA